MELIFRMKTGFFEKTAYRLEAGEKGLRLMPIQTEGTEPIVFGQEDLISVTLAQRRYPELEIQTREAVYAGSLEEGTTFEAVANYLKKYLNTKIICEYKGGA